MQPIEVTPIHPADYSQAAALFVQSYHRLREKIPALSNHMDDITRVESQLERLFNQCQGLAARQDGQLVGFMGWYIAPGFRGTTRTGAYVPEWGHCASAQVLPQVYRALYQKASTIWTAAKVQVHAITMLANNQAERDFWFWNGFGMLVVDAIRSMSSPGLPVCSELTIRKAVPADAVILHALDIEHCRHYTKPPVFMSPRQASVTSTQEWLEFLNRPENAVWIALAGKTPAGFIRFDANDVNGSTILEGESTVFISGAYVHPEYRGHGAATAILDAALHDYARRGYQRCVLDFESVNPQASTFWLRYFQPVAYSLMRIPEWVRGTDTE
jgi:GNAT superfamily N-acetyltransferase